MAILKKVFGENAEESKMKLNNSRMKKFEYISEGKVAIVPKNWPDCEIGKTIEISRGPFGVKARVIEIEESSDEESQFRLELITNVKSETCECVWMPETEYKRAIANESLTIALPEEQTPEQPLEPQWPLEPQSQRVQSICPNCKHHHRNALGRIWCSSDFSSFCALHHVQGGTTA
jgi:hypothetical protein